MQGFEEPTFRQHFAGWSDNTPSTPGKKATGKKSKKPSPASDAPPSSPKLTKAASSVKSPTASKTSKAASPAKAAASPAKSASSAQATKAPSPAEGSRTAKATTPTEEAADAEPAMRDEREETAIHAGAGTPGKQAAEAKIAEKDSHLDEVVAAKKAALASTETSSPAAARAAPVTANGMEAGSQKSPSAKTVQRSLPKVHHSPQCIHVGLVNLNNEQTIRPVSEAYACAQDSGFVPLPAATPAVEVPVKPPADLKYTAGKDTMPYEQLKGGASDPSRHILRFSLYNLHASFQQLPDVWHRRMMQGCDQSRVLI